MRDMEKWLGDGGMPIIADFGGNFARYGEGWVEGTWEPTALCCNPAGTVQAGIQAVLLDAAMNFALLTALERGDRLATLEMKASNLRAARAGQVLAVRGEVVRLARRIGFAQAWLRDGGDGTDVSHATGTFTVSRREP